MPPSLRRRERTPPAPGRPSIPNWPGDTITLVVQVNGKVRDKIEAPAGITETATREMALARPAVQKWLEGVEVRKVIFASGRLINIVVG